MKAPDPAYLDHFDDTHKAWRLFMLDTDAYDGHTEIVCSRLLTERAAVRRLHEAGKSRRPTMVLEARLIEFRKLGPDGSLRNFNSTSDFGTNSMLWELLARAWEARLNRGDK